MAKALFINERTLFSLTPIEANTDATIIRPHMITSQDIDLAKVIGNKLYNELQDSIVAENVSEKQNELIELIRPCLAWFIYSNALPFLLSKTTAKGVVNKTGENSNAVEENKMLFMKTDALNKAEFYAEQLKNYLRDNQSFFPLYINDTSANKSTQYNSSIYLTPNEKNYVNIKSDRRDYL